MTPERIANLASLGHEFVPQKSAVVAEWAELQRLALLGLRVEEAPTTVFCYSSGELGSLDGQRVALVVLP